MNKTVAYIALTFLLLNLASCLNTDFEDPNTEFSLFASLQENSEPLRRGNNEIRVLNVRFMLDNIVLESNRDKEQFESNQTYVNLNNFTGEQEVFIGAGEIFGGSYTGISFDLVTPADNSIQDDLFFDKDPTGQINHRYSVVIVGFFNQEEFVFRTSITPTVTYGFDRNVSMPEKLGVLRLDLVAEWEYWFLTDDNDELLNPSISADRKTIEENFKRFFSVNVFSIGEL